MRCSQLLPSMFAALVTLSLVVGTLSGCGKKDEYRSESTHRSTTTSEPELVVTPD